MLEERFTNEEWAKWLKEPITQRFMAILGKMRGEILEGWAAGGYSSATIDGSIQMTSEAIGRAGQLDYLIRMTADEYREMDDVYKEMDQHVGT